MTDFLKISIAVIALSPCAALSQGVGGYLESSDVETLTIKPVELVGTGSIPAEFASRLVDAVAASRLTGSPEIDIDQLSFFAAERQISGANWIQLELGQINIGEKSFIAIQSAQDGEVQIIDRAAGEGGEISAAFNGDTVYVYTIIHPDDFEFETSVADVGVPVESVTWGVPPAEGNLLPMAPLGGQSGQESQCGNEDNRVATSHPLVGRLMPVGCTGWLIEGGKVLTAGHCVDSSMRDLEFNVPDSSFIGITNRARLRDQYRVVTESIVASSPVKLGNDWAVFEILPNAITGRTAFDVQGPGFKISDGRPIDTVEVIGYGTDNTPSSSNQTQQSHTAKFVSETVRGDSDVLVKHKVDTEGGNSGSPVIGLDAAGNKLAFAIHTNAGCLASGGSNNATGFKNKALMKAIND